MNNCFCSILPFRLWVQAAMAVQGVMVSSIPRAIVLQNHSPVSQFRRTQSVGWCMALRSPQPARCFWSLPFCPKLRYRALVRSSCIRFFEGIGNG